MDENEPIPMSLMENQPDIGHLAMALHRTRAFDKNGMHDCGGECIRDAKKILMELNHDGWFITDWKTLGAAANRKIMLDHINNVLSNRQSFYNPGNAVENINQILIDGE